MIMVKIVRIAKKILIIIFLLIAITVTIYLFLFNRFNVTCLGNKYHLIFQNIKEYNNGSLLIVKQDINKIMIGDQIFFYNINTTKREILTAKVLSKEIINEKEITYGLPNQRYVSSSYVIGNAEGTKSIPLLGYFLRVVTSTLGYLILILIPVLFMFVYQLRNVIKALNLWGLYD